MPQGGEEGPRIDDRDGIALLRSGLAEAGFTPEGVRDAIMTEVSTGRDSAELPVYLRLLEGGGALATLIKLFLLDLDVPAGDAEAALPGLSLERLEAMGVVRRLDEHVSSALELVPAEDLMIACDAFQKELATSDHVLGVSSPARVLAWLTVRSPVERALDLGTGNGHQALLASRHASHVTAIDINPRALRFAAFNAMLNGADGIDFREGNLFEPVAGEKFDLIVCNPPYVVSPETDIVYRDGGLPGDSFSEKIVRELPAYLEPGGIGEVLVSWLHPLGGDWIEPVRRWVEGSGCDALLIRYAAHQPLDYAAAWNRPFRTNQELYAEKIAQWMDYFERIGVEEISWGALILRRREGENWFLPYTSTTERITGASDQILRLMEAQDYLAATGDEEMLDGVFALSGDHRVDQTFQIEDGRELVDRNVLRLATGLRFEVSLGQSTERMLLLLDGERPLGAVLVEAADGSGLSPEEFIGRALPIVRRLIELGFVLPA